MAEDFEKELNKSEKLLKERLIRAGKVAKDITDKSFREMVNIFDDIASKVDDITESLEKQLNQYDAIKTSTRIFGESLKRNVNYVKDNKDLTSKLTNIYKENNKLADKLVLNQEELVLGSLSFSDISKDIVKSKNAQLQTELAQRSIASEIEIIEKEIAESNKDQAEVLQIKIAALQEINEELIEEAKNQQNITNNLQEQASEAAKIESKVGVGGKLLKGFKKIPILGDLLDISGAEKAMQATAANGGGYFKTLGSGIKALGPSLKAALGPLALIQVAADAIKFIVEAMFEADEQATNIAKNMGITKEDAFETYSAFNDLTKEAGNFTKLQNGSIILQKQLIESTIQLNTLLGSSADFTKDLGEEGKELAIQFASAVKFLSLSEEEQQGLLNTTVATNKNIEDTKIEILGITRLRKIESGILLNERKILSDVLKTNNAIKLTIKGGAQGLTDAAIAAQKLGLNMSKVESISKSLLNFEDSISAELEAELLINKDINLERARQAALQGDIETVAKEINKQIGSSADFSRMNVIQQEALAKAMGTSREELADMLVAQENLNKIRGRFNALGDKTINQLMEANKIDSVTAARLQAGTGSATEYYDALQKAGIAQEEIVRILGEEASASLASQSAQEKFNEQLERAKEIFKNFVASDSLDKFATLLGDFINKWQKDGLLSALWNSGGGEEKPSAPINQTNQSQIERNELVTSRTGGLDDFIMRPGQPTQRFNKDDIVIGGTNLLGGNNGEVVSLLKELISVVKQGGDIYLDGTKMGTTMAVSTYKIQ
jgi:hypothetical protein